MQRNSPAREQVYMYRNQDFYYIRDWCLRRGYLFEDPYFTLDNRYSWKRPWEIVRNPQLYVGGIARFDILQGELGDCWMLASISALGMHPNLVGQVIPSDQSFSSQYAGVFHFRFWQFGRWYDVVIDDRLPTKHGKLVYTKSVSQNEFWSALLEKAYCKILGGEYKVADAGNLCEALEDFTGGVVEQFLLAKAPWNFASILVRSVERSSLIGCFIDDMPGSYQAQTPEGLVRGHSYSVTGARQVNLPGHGNIVLVRVRNPWGQFEWNGPWSDNSPEWLSVPQSTKEQLGLVYQDDGEFWMSFSDFVSHYQWIDMCHLSPDAFADAYTQDTGAVASWRLNKVRGSWVKGVSAGGARYLYLNPQIGFTLSEADDDNSDGYCSVLIALLQRANGCSGKQLEIGFKVYQLEYANQALDQSYFRNYQSVADVPTKRVREVAGRFNLSPGYYCVVPFTYEVGKESDFMVRIYSEKSNDMEQLDSRIGLSPTELTGGDEHPMTVVAKNAEEKKVEEGLKEYFDKVSGPDKEVDWKELKGVLEYVKKESLSPTKSDSGGIQHFLIDTATSIYNMIFGKRKAINAYKTVGPDGFSNDLCRSMVALMDVDHSGKLGMNEFQDLLTELKKWQKIYEQNSEKDGFLNSAGLKESLEAAGFHFNTKTLTDIVHRYASKDDKIPFDDFLHCGIKAKIMAKFFKSKEKSDSHKAEFTLEEFMDKTLYC